MARAEEVGLATGYRVAAVGAGCQVQKLELAPGGDVRVARVWPGDAAHLALWQALTTPEKAWVLAPVLRGADAEGSGQ